MTESDPVPEARHRRTPSINPIRVGILGCGDVALRRYLPALRHLGDTAAVAWCCDADAARARHAADACATWAPKVEYGSRLSPMLDRCPVDGVFNLTPARSHHETNAELLEHGVHVFSEKPLALQTGDADALIDVAFGRELMMVCAPAIMATERFRWLAALLESQRIGTPTLATAHHGDMGPAGWRDYSGDPAAYYRADVGPLMDEGIYLVHALTGLLGPARAVHALAANGPAIRPVLGARARREAVPVHAPDHVLVLIEFVNGAVAQLTSSFAMRASRAPTIEIHGMRGSVSVDDLFSANGPVNVFIGDDAQSPVVEGWVQADPRSDGSDTEDNVVAVGAAHFIDCLRGGVSLLTPQHARHAVEVVNAASTSRTSRVTVDLHTTFEHVARRRSNGNRDGREGGPCSTA